MSRCVICDYLQGYGSELHDEPNRWNKRVKWRHQYNEYQCDDCFREIVDIKYGTTDPEVSTAEEELPPLPIE